MAWIAILMMLSGAVVGTGAALEFAYFGPGTSQFTAGLIATPAGLAGLVGGAALWRRGRRARPLVAMGAIGLLLGTAGATILDVMGPPAMLIGLAGGLPPLVWLLQQRGVEPEERADRASEER